MKHIFITLFIFTFILAACSNQKTDYAQVKIETILSELILPETEINENNFACPSDMALVDGEYCPNLSEPCLKWEPKKHGNPTVCLEFKFPTICLSKETKHMRYCIDKKEYTAPEETLPKVMINYYEMKKICTDQGKRLCSDIDLTKATEGPENKPYPYGYIRDSTACQIDLPYREWNQIKIQHKDMVEFNKVDQRIPSGSMPRCVSDYGVYDLVGGVDEISENVTNHGKPYNLALHGGHNLKGASNQARKLTLVHNNWFFLYNSGGRCCSEAQNENN